MMSDDAYVEMLLEPLRKCAAYRPAFGRNEQEGTSIEEFRLLYGSDPFYHWMGLDSDLMYAAHKAAGGMTSIYRQLGIGCERFFRGMLRDSLGLGVDEVLWKYETTTEDGHMQVLALDGRIDAQSVRDGDARARFEDWMRRACAEVGVDAEARQLHGAIFEVRQGYKSADSKRQNADLRSGMRAYAEGYLPVVLLFSRQVNRTVESRYRGAGLRVLIGTLDGSDIESTFAFCREIVGYDAAAFFQRNQERLHEEFLAILRGLLSPR